MMSKPVLSVCTTKTTVPGHFITHFESILGTKIIKKAEFSAKFQLQALTTPVILILARNGYVYS